jgi:putative oxidoreductase
MEGIERLRAWLDARRELWLDCLRVYLGFALLAKGISFIISGNTLFEAAHEIGFGDALVAHYVVMAHVGGGVLLGIGLVTRLAAAVQVPVLAGAVLFVHRKEGLFTPQMTLEFTILVLALLVLFTIAGGGPLSVDHWLHRRNPAEAPKPA